MAKRSKTAKKQARSVENIGYKYSAWKSGKLWPVPEKLSLSRRLDCDALLRALIVCQFAKFAAPIEIISRALSEQEQAKATRLLFGIVHNNYELKDRVDNLIPFVQQHYDWLESGVRFDSALQSESEMACISALKRLAKIQAGAIEIDKRMSDALKKGMISDGESTGTITGDFEEEAEIKVADDPISNILGSHIIPVSEQDVHDVEKHISETQDYVPKTLEEKKKFVKKVNRFLDVFWFRLKKENDDHLYRLSVVEPENSPEGVIQFTGGGKGGSSGGFTSTQRSERTTVSLVPVPENYLGSKPTRQKKKDTKAPSDP